MTSLHLFDLLVIAGYFLVLPGIGYVAPRREKKVSADYFLAKPPRWLVARGGSGGYGTAGSGSRHSCTSERVPYRMGASPLGSIR